MSQSVALLIRSLNVGAHNRITMKELAQILAEDGLESVSTFLQSGNVRLETNLKGHEAADFAEKSLSRHFKKPITVVGLPWRRLVELTSVDHFTSAELTSSRGLGIFLKQPNDHGKSLTGNLSTLKIIRAEYDVLLCLVEKGQAHALDFKKLIEKPLGTLVTARFWNVIEDWVRKVE